MAGQTSVGCGKAEAAPGSGSPEWMVVIRVYGSIMYATKRWGTDDPEQSVPLEPQHIEGWMADCVRHGITTVLWRANCAGTLTYPSKFAPLTGEQVLPDSFRLGDKTIERNWPHEDWAFLGKQCRSFNTLEAAVTAAHQRGLKFYLEWEKWARQDWVDGLEVFAPFEGGVAEAQKMRSTAQKPIYLQRKYSGFKGKFTPPQSLEGFRREIGAVRNGALDGYVLHVLWIVKHHWMDPDWRDLLS